MSPGSPVLVTSMPIAHPERPADRLAVFLNALVRAVADTFPKGQRGQLLLWQRLMRLGAHFTAILAAVRRPHPSAGPPPARPDRPASRSRNRRQNHPGKISPSCSGSFRDMRNIAASWKICCKSYRWRNACKPPRNSAACATRICRMLNLQPLPPPPALQTPGPQTPGTDPAPQSTNARPSPKPAGGERPLVVAKARIPTGHDTPTPAPQPKARPAVPQPRSTQTVLL
jgi:hypothetical protein